MVLPHVVVLVGMETHLVHTPRNLELRVIFNIKSHTQLFPKRDEIPQKHPTLIAVTYISTIAIPKRTYYKYSVHSMSYLTHRNTNSLFFLFVNANKPAKVTSEIINYNGNLHSVITVAHTG